MAEKFVAKTTGIQGRRPPDRILGDTEIGVFRHKGQFYAYSNTCLHQGGPACEGLIIAKVEERLRPDKTSRRAVFLRNRDTLRLSVARLRIRHEDRRMRRRPEA